LAFVAGRLKNGLIETMTAEQILKEIEALPKAERQRLVERMREATSTNIPEDFIDGWRISIKSASCQWTRH